MTAWTRTGAPYPPAYRSRAERAPNAGAVSPCLVLPEHERATVLLTGDEALLEDEALEALLRATIHFVAIRQPMTGEQPRPMFLHYLGQSRATKPARRVKTARDGTAAEQDK